MLIQLIVVAIAVANGVGLANFLNSTREEEESDLSVKNVIMGIAFASLIIIVFKLIAKLMYNNEGVKEISSTVKQSKENKSRCKLKKRVLKLEEKKISGIVKEKYPSKLEVHLVDEKEEELRREKEELDVTNGTDENVQEMVDQDICVEDEEWICVKKKERKKKNKHSRENKIDYNLGSTSSIKSMKEGIVRNDKEKKRSVKPKKSLLKTSEKSETNYAQKFLTELPDIESAKDKDVTIVSDNAFKVRSDIEDRYLKQGAKPKTNSASTSRIIYAKKVSARLPNIKSASRKRNSSYVENEEASVYVMSQDIVPSSCVDFCQKSDVVNISNDEFSALVQSASMSSGLCFKEGVKSSKSSLYKKTAIKYCNQLREFRKLHFTYCVKLVNRIFQIKDSRLVVSEEASYLFGTLTSHVEVLFFILKVFFLVNFSALFGGGSMITSIRYCATYFYDQSLLDLLISEVITNAPKVIISAKKERNGLRDIFKVHCKHICGTDSYEPYSGEFFQKIFSIFHSLASVTLPEEAQELVDFATLACVVYCGHMVSVLCRMLINNYSIKCVENELIAYLKGRSFCRRCRNTRGAIIHMYHPANEQGCIKNVGGINVPLTVWRNCSKEVDDLVVESINQDNLSFVPFVKSMISRTKELILLPDMTRCYEDNIKMYNTNLKTVKTLLPLPSKRILYPSKEIKSSKLCNL